MKIKQNVKIFILLTIGIFIYGYLGYSHLKDKELQEINYNLYRAAKNIPYYLGDDYTFKNMDKNSHTHEKILEATEILNEMSRANKVDYLYTIIDEKNMPTYTAIGGNVKKYIDKVKNRDSTGLYWIDFQALEDDSIGETIDILKNKTIHYIDSTDKGGGYRSVYLVLKSKDKRKYIAGADIKMKNLNLRILKKFTYIILNGVLIILLVLLLISTTRRILSQKEKISEELYLKSNFDNLTGVLKRERGMKELNELINYNNTNKMNKNIYFGLFDIVDLTYINNEFGMEIGDKAIISLVCILRETFRTSDKIIRLNGDQFLVVIESSLDSKEIMNLEERFLEKLEKFNKIKENEYKIFICKVFNEYKKDLSIKTAMKTLFDQLDFEKTQGDGVFYLLGNDIKKGIENEEFKIYYQPKVNVRTKQVEFEALMRWFHPEKGEISPGIFIPIAEKTSLIIDLTDFLIEQVKKDIVKLKTSVSLNISPIHFNKKYFSKEIITKHGTLKGINFELTEGAFIDDIDKSIEKINDLKKIGINFFIDDFGTGYSSLSYLSKLPVTTLKIDRSFVINMFECTENMKIIKTIIELGKSLNLEVIVEGTETIEEINMLKEMGVELFQGYYYGKPEELGKVIKKIDEKEYIKKI
ncbi:MAG: GGDEF domain-containing phosphodiesterase [Psychrilyobacter sp.]|uniref:putative bifunctional diguanylate cyclase/phosphodiesterase n=1 Tax=Psychrilyobacter sp. TaxID=2586924 RepID=UPI003C7321D4